MPFEPDHEDEIDTTALKKLEDLQRQKMIDLFGFDPDSRDSAPPKKAEEANSFRWISSNRIIQKISTGFKSSG